MCYQLHFVQARQVRANSPLLRRLFFPDSLQEVYTHNLSPKRSGFKTPKGRKVFMCYVTTCMRPQSYLVPSEDVKHACVCPSVRVCPFVRGSVSHLFVCLSICLSVSLDCLSVCRLQFVCQSLSASLSVSLHASSSVPVRSSVRSFVCLFLSVNLSAKMCLSVSLHVCQSVCLSFRSSVHLSVRSGMSKCRNIPKRYCGSPLAVTSLASGLVDTAIPQVVT